MDRKMLTESVVLIILLLGGWGVFQSLNTSGQLIQTDAFEGIIFNAQAAERSKLSQLLPREIEGYWPPTQNDVMQMEAELKTYLKQTAQPERKRMWEELTDYKRQYAGIVRNGQQVFCQQLLYGRGFGEMGTHPGSRFTRRGLLFSSVIQC